MYLLIKWTVGSFFDICDTFRCQFMLYIYFFRTTLKKYEEYMMHFWKNFPYVMDTGKNMQTMKLTLVQLTKSWKFMNGQS